MKAGAFSSAAFSATLAGREAGDRVAILDAGRERSYAELAADTANAATQLRSRNIVRGQRVAFQPEARYADVVRLCALLEIGAPAVLLHPRWSASERATMLESAQPVRHLDSREPHLEPPVLEDLGTDTLAYVATSGTSSGRPKWAALEARALSHAVAASAERLGWRPDDRWLLSLPLAHIGGLSILLRCLAARRAVVLDTLTWSRPASVLAALHRGRVSLLSVVPTQLARLLDAGLRPPLSLRAVLVGGAAATSQLLARAADDGWPVLATYGSTETCSQVSTWRPGEPSSHHGSGPPLGGTQVRIASDGGVEINGPSLMRGYLPPGGPQPFTADGWLRTGDRGHLDHGACLHLHGRSDDLIVSGGENVHPLEVEAALVEHPAVRQAMVFGIDDPEWGQLVAALLVPADDFQPAADTDLLDHLRQRLAGFKRPRRIAWIDTLPSTATGKPDRRRAASVAQLRPLS